MIERPAGLAVQAVRTTAIHCRTPLLFLEDVDDAVPVLGNVLDAVVVVRGLPEVPFEEATCEVAVERVLDVDGFDVRILEAGSGKEDRVVVALDADVAALRVDELPAVGAR